MKIVLDTNVLVSGLLKATGPASEILRLAVSGNLRLLYDARILLEYRTVLLRPRFAFDPNDIHDLLAYLEFSGTAVAAPPLAREMPHRDDAPFLEVALAGKARYLVTGNTRHFPPRISRPVTVLLPTEFLKKYRGK